MSPTPKRQPMVKCPHCGALNDPARGSKYCFSCNLPLSKARGDEGFLYLVEFNQGTLKVGYSKRPTARIKQHEKAADVFGISVKRTWISAPHREATENERLAITWCAAHATTVRGAEWFTGVAFADAKAYIESLPANRMTDAQFAAREQYLDARGRQLTEQLTRPAWAKLTGELNATDAEHVALVSKIAETTSSGARWILANEKPRAVLYRFLQEAADAFRVKDEPTQNGVITEWEWLTNPDCDGRWSGLREPLYDLAEVMGFDLEDVVIEGGA